MALDDENVLQKLLLFLIYQMQTIDGRQGSAKELIGKKIQQLKLEQDEDNEFYLSNNQIEQTIRSQIALKVLTKYKLLIARMKLSYSALLRQSTILELWVRQIASTYKLLRDTG